VPLRHVLTGHIRGECAGQQGFKRPLSHTEYFVVQMVERRPDVASYGVVATSPAPFSGVRTPCGGAGAQARTGYDAPRSCPARGRVSADMHDRLAGAGLAEIGRQVGVECGGG